MQTREDTVVNFLVKGVSCVVQMTSLYYHMTKFVYLPTLLARKEVEVKFEERQDY